MGNMAWEASVNDPIYTLNAFRNGSDHINFSNGEHKRYQHILSLAEREVDLQKRWLYYLNAEKILMKERPVIPIHLIAPKALKKKSFSILSPISSFKWGYFV
jgi:ABC-type oligopeptide transport system substrate-binding subunit